jgi:hypothetical protein
LVIHQEEFCRLKKRLGSICAVNGYLMVYPLESNITWHSGFDSMTTYTFGREKIAHTFCSTCGTSIGGKSTDPKFFSENRALNVSLKFPQPLCPLLLPLRWRMHDSDVCFATLGRNPRKNCLPPVCSSASTINSFQNLELTGGNPRCERSRESTSRH